MLAPSEARAVSTLAYVSLTPLVMNCAAMFREANVPSSPSYRWMT